MSKWLNALKREIEKEGASKLVEWIALTHQPAMFLYSDGSVIFASSEPSPRRRDYIRKIDLSNYQEWINDAFEDWKASPENEGMSDDDLWNAYLETWTDDFLLNDLLDMLE